MNDVHWPIWMKGIEEARRQAATKRERQVVASASVWILVLTRRERSIAWSIPAFLGARAVLVSAHDGAVDHRISVVGVGREVSESSLPGTGLGPAAEGADDVPPVTEAFRHIMPRYPAR